MIGERPLRRALGGASVVTAIPLFAAWAGVMTGGVHWDMDSRDEVTEAHRITPLRVMNGLLSGQAGWDPYLYLRLPEEGLDVSGLPYLTVRLYSSGEADSLDVYYKCADETWGLGGTVPIQRGWATYRVDLRQARWTEAGMSEAGRQWGGVEKRIVSFRIDPGNQEDRFVVIDSVSLTEEPTGDLGVSTETRGRISGARLSCAAEVTAGDPITASYAFEAADYGGATAHVLLRVMSGAAALQAELREVVMADGEIRVQHEFPTSAYDLGGERTVIAEVLELDGEPASMAACVVSNPRAGAAPPLRTEIADYRGEPTLYVNGQPRPLITYLHYGGERGELHAQAAAAGLKVYSDWFGGSEAGDLGQVSSGGYDYGAFDAYFATVLDRVPDAYFLPHLGVVAPRWWQAEHPEECALYSTGARGPSSVFSELWQQEMGEDLRRLIAHLRSAPYADRILGIIFYAGYTAEWQMWSTWEEFCDDYSEPAHRAFRAWLREQYGDDAGLQAAWRDPEVTIETAAIASCAERRGPGPFLRDPAEGRRVIDLNRFNSEGTAAAIEHFASVAKEATEGEWIAGTYYGYMAAHGMRQQLTGHNALARILRCPDVDMLMAPNMYQYRWLGGTSTFMSATESVKLHGKLWFDESDLRTYLSDPAAGCGRTETPEESVAVTWREFANVLTRRVAVGWYDMGGGWYSDEPMWECYRQQMPVAERAFARREPFDADVAVIIDEVSSDYYRMSDLYRLLVVDTVADLPLVGVSWDCLLASDLGDARVPDYRVYWVLNACAMEPEARDALVAKAGRTGATVVFVYAPGAVAQGPISAKAIGDSVGMQVAFTHAGTPDYVIEPGAALGDGLDPQLGQCPGVELDPRPVIIDPEATVIARYADGAGVAVAARDVGGAHVIYCASVRVSVPLMRNVARAAGAHVYIDSGDGVYTDGQYLAIHAASDGEKVVTLPSPRRIVDVRSGEVVAEHADRIIRPMRHGETMFLELGE